MEDTRNYYIVAELMSGGHLMEKIVSQQSNSFTEQRAGSIIH